MMGKVAFITGITGQDGSYLTELLLGKGYVVHGIVRRSSMLDRPRLDHLTADPNIYGRTLFLHYADLSDCTTVRRLLIRIKPDECYHLAGQSHVGLSFEIPESTCDFTAMGTLRILEIIRDLGKPVRFLNIASSEIFGAPAYFPQNEYTALRPVSPYGVAKAFAFDITRVYREAFGLYACSAICYNHESPRRGSSFVTRKIVRGVADIVAGKAAHLTVGNLGIERDWGFAPEYVEAMWRMLQQERAEDLVLATGHSTSLIAFLDTAFSVAGLDWRQYVRTDPRFERPVEPGLLVGDPSRARAVLNWEASVKGIGVADIMVRAELSLNTIGMSDRGKNEAQ